MSIYLDTTIATCSVGTASRLSEKRDVFQYVPLLDGLVSLLKNPEIYSEVCKTIEVTYFQLIDLLFQVMKPHFRSDNLIGDYCDAELCTLYIYSSF